MLASFISEVGLWNGTKLSIEIASKNLLFQSCLQSKINLNVSHTLDLAW